MRALVEARRPFGTLVVVAIRIVKADRTARKVSEGVRIGSVEVAQASNQCRLSVIGSLGQRADPLRPLRLVDNQLWAVDLRGGPQQLALDCDV